MSACIVGKPQRWAKGQRCRFQWPSIGGGGGGGGECEGQSVSRLVVACCTGVWLPGWRSNVVEFPVKLISFGCSVLPACLGERGTAWRGLQSRLFGSLVGSPR